MTKNNRMHAFFTYFFCVVVYFVALGANETFLTSLRSNYEISFSEYDQIEYYKILGYVAASICLLVFSRFLSLKVFMILCTVLYLLSMVAISSSDINNQTNFFYFSLYSASYLIIGSAIFIYIFCDTDLSSEFNLICICLASIVSFFINEIKFFVVTIDGLAGLVITNVILLGIFVLINLNYPIFKKKIKSTDYNFSGVVKNMELEILCGFSLFYILMIVIDGYDIYSMTDQLFTIVDTSIRHYMMVLIVFVISLLMLYVKKVNIHRVSIGSIGLSFTLFVTMPFWAGYNVLGLVGWFILGVLYSIIFVTNILGITKKFDEINLVTAFSLYLLGCCAGYYCGYITIDTSEDTLGENGFLISICFVLLSLLIYYVYLFRKYKLSQ